MNHMFQYSNEKMELAKEIEFHDYVLNKTLFYNLKNCQKLEKGKYVEKKILRKG